MDLVGTWNQANLGSGQIKVEGYLDYKRYLLMDLVQLNKMCFQLSHPSVAGCQIGFVPNPLLKRTFLSVEAYQFLSIYQFSILSFPPVFNWKRGDITFAIRFWNSMMSACYHPASYIDVVYGNACKQYYKVWNWHHLGIILNVTGNFLEDCR